MNRLMANDPAIRVADETNLPGPRTVRSLLGMTQILSKGRLPKVQSLYNIKADSIPFRISIKLCTLVQNFDQYLPFTLTAART